MSRTKPFFLPEPRIWNVYQVATRLGVSENHFAGQRKGLEALGFPAKDPVLGGWDSCAIERWLDKRAGLVEQFSPEDIDEGIKAWENSGCGI